MFAFIVTAAQPCATLTTNRINLVDKDNAGRLFLGLLEHVPYARSTHTNKHLHEIGSGNTEERNLGLARDGTGQKGFTGAGITHHQYAAGDAAPKLLKLGGITQEIDQFRHLFFGFLAAGNIGKSHGVGRLIQHACLALAKRKRTTAASAALHLAHEENPHTNQ